MTDNLPDIERLTKQLKQAASSLTETEARFLVDAYYLIQEDRKRSFNQIASMTGEPVSPLLWWFARQNELFESQIKRTLDVYTDHKPIGRWLKSIHGIGPVIAAGLLAHIDIKKAVTAGHIWRFAGLDPTMKWEKGKKRPWNASLKTLCWKIGQSFMKFSGSEKCVYGQLYKSQKAKYQAINEAGGYAARAAELAPRFNRATEAYKHLTGGKLPPGQIDAMARRWCVKIFLSHLQQVWYELETGSKPPKPFAIAIMGHAHMIEPPAPIE